MSLQRGQLGRQCVVHWEDPGLRALFPRGITPSDFDGWRGYVDLDGRAGGAFVPIEFKHEQARIPLGQAQAIDQIRAHLRDGDWFLGLRHDGANGEIWARNVTRWTALPCGARLNDGALRRGTTLEQLRTFLMEVDAASLGPDIEPDLRAVLASVVADLEDIEWRMDAGATVPRAEVEALRHRVELALDLAS